MLPYTLCIVLGFGAATVSSSAAQAACATLGDVVDELSRLGDDLVLIRNAIRDNTRDCR